MAVVGTKQTYKVICFLSKLPLYGELAAAVRVRLAEISMNINDFRAKTDATIDKFTLEMEKNSFFANFWVFGATIFTALLLFRFFFSNCFEIYHVYSLSLPSYNTTDSVQILPFSGISGKAAPSLFTEHRRIFNPINNRESI